MRIKNKKLHTIYFALILKEYHNLTKHHLSFDNTRQRALNRCYLFQNKMSSHTSAQW